MAQVKIAYIGGGSTRAPGTVASFIRQAANFSGSEIVLQDIDEERLDLVCRLSRKMAAAQGADLKISATTDRRAALDGCDGVLSSYRPGGFEARAQDERIPLHHGAIGQETQGAGGFFMALRAIHIARGLVEDMQAICPDATLFNYTNPVNIVAQAVADHSAIKVVSLCEGPIVFPQEIAELAGLDPAKVRAVMLGLNHACWSAQTRSGGAEYDGQPMLPILAQKLAEGISDDWARCWISLAVQMDSLPASYMKYYYFEREMLRELLDKPTTRAEDILRDVPSYWQHYRQQLDAKNPVLEPELSRGGIFELEVAVDVMDALFNDKNEIWPTNVANAGAIQDFPDSRVVEVPCLVNRQGVRPLGGYRVPPPVRGLLSALGEYQQLAADAAWSGSRKEAIAALTSNPLVRTLPLAQTLYDELARAHRQFLPERLW
ncbi:glycoside hydrolase [Deinococcus detaillensis]|uniref:Glycoside hydrolase n=1 Tax=Deinococcus detaillensis TaxID=2592048 RepID=A0A553V592_9DEIO|nr:glycoside hydrolase [Deinococcus detaillensis]TSA87554.1 glycoside hydrolase [Deinococcus detaillensis]